MLNIKTILNITITLLNAALIFVLVNFITTK